MNAKKTRFLLQLIFATLCMGSSFPTGKYLISYEKMPPFLMGGWRFMAAGFFMLVLTVFTKSFKSIIPLSQGSLWQGLLLVSLVGFLQTTATMGFLNLALESISSSMSSIILFTNPLWLALLAHFFLGEKLNKKKVMSLIVGIIGVSLCLGIEIPMVGHGLMFAFLGSICWSICTVVSKLFTFDKDSGIFTGWQLFLGGLFMLLISGARHENFAIENLHFWGWIWLVWLIIPASIGSFGLWFSALRLGGATQASGFLFLAPLFSTLFSIVSLHDALTPQLVAGGLLIILSLYFINKEY